MIRKILKVVCWPFTKALGWLASGLPSGKKEKNPDEIEPDPIKCYTHSRYKKSCAICRQALRGV